MKGHEMRGNERKWNEMKRTGRERKQKKLASKHKANPVHNPLQNPVHNPQYIINRKQRFSSKINWKTLLTVRGGGGVLWITTCRKWCVCSLLVDHLQKSRSHPSSTWFPLLFMVQRAFGTVPPHHEWMGLPVTVIGGLIAWLDGFFFCDHF